MSQPAIFLCGFSFHFLFTITSLAQQPQPDSALYKESVYNIYQNYFNQIGENAFLYNGSEYIRNGQKAKGFPFFQSDSMLIGSVFYRGSLYQAVNMQYDLVLDELITNNYPHNALITLAKENVDSFTLDGHFFLHITEAKAKGISKGDGYYERLFANEIEVVAMREKKLVTPSGYEDAKYTEHSTYYIKLDNIYNPVDSKSSLLELFKDRRDQLKKYIRVNKLNFKKRFEEALVQTTNYYSLLKH